MDGIVCIVEERWIIICKKNGVIWWWFNNDMGGNIYIYENFIKICLL